MLHVTMIDLWLVETSRWLVLAHLNILITRVRPIRLIDGSCLSILPFLLWLEMMMSVEFLQARVSQFRNPYLGDDNDRLTGHSLKSAERASRTIELTNSGTGSHLYAGHCPDTMISQRGYLGHLNGGVPPSGVNPGGQHRRSRC